MPRETAATSKPIPSEWLAEFEAATRRPLKQRFKYAFIKLDKPVLDDVNYRSRETMEEYRQWCEDNLPDWLGYSPSKRQMALLKLTKLLSAARFPTSMKDKRKEKIQGRGATGKEIVTGILDRGKSLYLLKF